MEDIRKERLMISIITLSAILPHVYKWIDANIDHAVQMGWVKE